ncbi:MAG: T9SS type A sorting domain-containing protein [Calditrichaeota bacterium]|nr:T9SS type A sorting domain-containing protein [Calditrichota bacterium]
MQITIFFIFFLSVNTLMSQQIGKSWEFNDDGNAEGWQAYRSLSDLTVSGGTLKAKVTGVNAAFFGPECDIIASDYWFIHIRMLAIGATRGKLYWKTDSNISDYMIFPVVGDSSFHEYELLVHSSNKWTGHIKSFPKFYINGETGTQIEIDYIRVVSLGPRYEFKDFKPLRTVLKQGQPIPLMSTIQNTGDKTGSFTANLLFPEKVNLTSGDRLQIRELAAGEEDTLHWTINSNTTGHYNLKLLLLPGNGDTLKSTFDAHVVDQFWTLDNFFLSAWSPPSLTDESYQYYSNANFPMVLWIPPDETAVVWPEKYNLRCMPQAGGLLGENKYLRAPNSLPSDELTPADLQKLDGMIESFKENQAVCGYYITDEPSTQAFPNLAKVVSYLHEKDPTRLSYINLFPSYASVGQTGTRNYEKYVEQFLDIVKPELLSYDHYHFFNDHDGPEYFYNLGIIRKWALKYDIPFCNIIQAIGWTVGNWRIPTAGEHRWLVYSSLAYGAKGIVWFHWNSNWGVTGSPKRDELYASIQKLNAEINSLGPVMLKLDSKAVYHSGSIPMGGVALPNNALIKSVSANADLVIGLFKDEKDADYVMLMNKDYDNRVTATIRFSRSFSQLEAFNTNTEEWQNVNYQNTTGGAVLNYSFLPGGGVLFKTGEIAKVNNVGAALPSRYNLEANYPNPFNPDTNIKYHLAAKGRVKLAVYDILGCEVAVLVDKMQKAGSYKIHWVADNLPSGIYVYRLQAGSTVKSRKMLLLK